MGKKYVSTVCDGQVYVLSVNESTDPGTPVGGWQAVGGLDHVLEGTLASNTDDVEGGPLYVTVLTRPQEVWEGRCPSTLPLGPCEFTQLPDPPQWRRGLAEASSRTPVRTSRAGVHRVRTAGPVQVKPGDPATRLTTRSILAWLTSTRAQGLDR